MLGQICLKSMPVSEVRSMCPFRRAIDQTTLTSDPYVICNETVVQVDGECAEVVLCSVVLNKRTIPDCFPI